jgi:3-dehydroquinate synthetase
MKLGITGNDPIDRRGGREMLNFGHTIGHALEQVTEYKRFTHGAAVGLGMLVALRCGTYQNSVRLLDEMKDALIANGLPISISNDISEDALVDSIKRDKKGGKWILLRDIGDAYTSSSVTEEKIREAIKDLRTK